ncbi:MAG: flagellar M-ring protein FliF [Chitinispirillales bacterium]|jgi:flagellar M-ring protein FliF|nr:flagellar M-ring protein FliF [Chitinispirillales bacterium]
MNDPNEPRGGGTAEFFRQLIVQFSALWQKLSFQQKLITSSLVGITLIGLIGLLFFAHTSGGGGKSGGGGASSGGMKVLYSDLELEEASQITEQLNKGGYKYKLENNGRNVLVNPKQLYEIRMALAREGLPRKRGIGYELFDKTNLGMTDFTQKLNARRALEGELQRTIEDLDEVKSARVHLVTPEHTIFLDQQKDSKASVVVRTMPGRELSKDQIRGITHLVSSSVDGLKPQNISIVDIEGKLLSSPFSDNESAMASSQNRELQQNVERYLENKASQMLAGVFGHSKAMVKIAADLDFDQVEKTIETFDPESRVIRSEERQDENTKNAPDGDHQRERSLTNYEIDKTVQRVVQEIGNVRRITVSVAVDGKYETGADGKRAFVDRDPAEMQKIEELVKNAVGYDLARGDQITVTSLQFDNELLRLEQDRLRDEEKQANRALIIKLILAAIAGIAFLLLVRSIARAVTEAMNPPVPVLEQLGLEDLVEEEDPTESQVRASAILEKVELLTNQAPVNIAAIIKQWLVEGVTEKKH